MVVNMFQQLLFLIIIITNAGTSLPCAPGEVTQPYTFTTNISQQNVVLWKRGDEQIATCSTSNLCTLFEDRNIYEATRSGLMTTLQIKNVTTQSGGIYTCEGDGPESLNCDFKVYAKPDSVTCQDPEFRAVTQDVAVVCTVQKIYPNPVCLFSWFINNTESWIINKNLVEYNNLAGSESSSYFNKNCSFNLPARNFALGKHQFHLTAYPDVTGQGSDAVYGKNSTPISPKYVVNPAATLNCSNTTVQENKQVSCTCRETANTFILATTTLFYGTANVSSSLQHITAPITVNRNTSEIICQAQLPEGTKINKTQSLNVYFGPSIFNFEVNTNSEQIILEGNSAVGFSCQAEGNPSLNLTLRQNGEELAKFTYPTHKFNLTLTYNIAMAECLDTGVYMCLAETGQTAAYKTVAVYVKCAQQLRNADSLSHIYKGQVNHKVLISIPVFGFPEPNVTLYCNNYTIYPDAYNLTYIKQEPPYGTVSLMIHIGNASFFQHYSLNVDNSEGQLTYLFEIVEGEISGDESPDQDVGAIVGGIVAALLVIVVIAAAIFLWKRKGVACKPKDHQCASTSVHKPYENAESGVLPEAPAPENPHYEEIMDFQTDVPDKPVYCTNQISNIQHAKADYQNSV